MKVALLADIHGNAAALQAVLKAAREASVECLMVAGDLVGYYYQIDDVLRQLSKWKCLCISGNHERMLKSWLEGHDRDDILRKYGSALQVSTEVLTSQQLQELISLPARLQSEISGRTFLLCHGSPWDADEYIYPDADKATKDRIFTLGADLVVYGHTHYPTKWENKGKIVVNPGSVGQPRDRIPGACWALWDTETNQVSFYREKYDAQELLDQIRLRDPELHYLSRALTRTS